MCPPSEGWDRVVVTVVCLLSVLAPVVSSAIPVGVETVGGAVPIKGRVAVVPWSVELVGSLASQIRSGDRDLYVRGGDVGDSGTDRVTLGGGVVCFVASLQ